MVNLEHEAEALFGYSQMIRRDLHQHPELGYKEVRTAGIVARELSALGLEIRTGIAETGVIGIIEGDKPGPVIMLRFDMDALAVKEETGADYASCMPGLMHACGHDGHVAIGLTVAKLLFSHRKELAGTVKLIFQPAEEGLNGAEKMILEGALGNPKPNTALALHLWNEQPVGWIAASAGPLMAGSAMFTIKITGKGGHGALPHQAVDPVTAAAQVISALQSIVSRNISPQESGVVSVTYLRAGEAFNVIPPSAEMWGTLRWFLPEVREILFNRVRLIVENIAEAMGCNSEIDIHDLTPALVNDEPMTRRAQEVIKREYPDMMLVENYHTMGSEDMAFFLEKIPGCFLMVGANNHEKGLDYAHHHPRFDFDETVLPRASAVVASIVMDYLS